MKKMGLLIALATVLTVGGVYATWQYADTTDVENQSTVIVGITGSEASAAVGTIGFTGAFAFDIDQAGTNDYHGKLVKATGCAEEVVFTFSPSAGAPAGWADGKVKFSWEISINAGTYNTKSILVLDDAKKSKTEATADDLTWSITADEMLAAVSVNQDFTVPTSTDYNNFKQAIADTTPSITVTVSVAEN